MFRTLAHILVLSALLTTTSGVTLTKHFCQGEFKGLHIYQPDYRCCKIVATSCHEPGWHKTSCCANETIQLKSELTQYQVTTVTPAQKLWSINWIFPHPRIQCAMGVSPATILIYHPPPLALDLPVLFQTFRC